MENEQNPQKTSDNKEDEFEKEIGDESENITSPTIDEINEENPEQKADSQNSDDFSSSSKTNIAGSPQTYGLDSELENSSSQTGENIESAEMSWVAGNQDTDNSVEMHESTSDIEGKAKTGDLKENIGIGKVENVETIELNQLAEKVIEKASARKNYNPIINEIFKKLLERCTDNFNFIGEQNRIPYEQYLEYYRELNRLYPRLERKIITEDCLGSVFYIGDSHGSIEDSFHTINFFMRIIKSKPEDKFIFVGDYVDRNPFDLQNLTLITAFSVIFQDQVILLRGNHEDRIINEYYGFKDNLLRRFYDKADELYEEIIKFFTHLPMAHIAQMYDSQGTLKARIFAVHGGIPIDPLNFLEPIKVEDLEDLLDCEKETYNEMDILSQSMLWSDPDELIQGIVTDPDGTGRMQFGWPVLERFLKANNIDVVVRGHQKWKSGYKVFFNYRLFSLFSTSKYNNIKKFEPKILQLELGKAPRFIQIDPENLMKVSEEYLREGQ